MRGCKYRNTNLQKLNVRKQTLFAFAAAWRLLFPYATMQPCWLFPHFLSSPGAWIMKSVLVFSEVNIAGITICFFSAFLKFLINFLDINFSSQCWGRNCRKYFALCERRCGCRCLQVLQPHVRLARQHN